MLLANNEQMKLVSFAGCSLEEIRPFRKKKFYCPICQEEVILKAGGYVTAHFAHKHQSICTNQGEGSYHETGKWTLYQWFLNQHIKAEVEVFIPVAKQRADILLQIGNKQIAIEYQCASISEQEVRRRTLGFLKNSITPIWILGGNRMKRLAAQKLHIEKIFLHQWSSKHSPTLYYFCPIQKQFATYHITTAYSSDFLQFISLKDVTFTKLLTPHPAPYTEINWLKNVQAFRKKPPPTHIGNDERQWRQWLYQHHLYPPLLPSICFLPVRYQFRMKCPGWMWQSMIVFQLMQRTGISFRLKDCHQLLASKIVPLSSTPLIRSMSDPIQEYLDRLVELGILLKYNSTYICKFPISLPTTIDEAISQDRSCWNKLKVSSKW
ncbi:competence protein CoiA [Radiobacillus deserti]|uniref:Competence protein CoiA n=1 Tax=Radiobacillus deserti TaxID=2594883 RepID=A0A516KEF4_9BACI|nr:competence protein CoiA family protein [Radiobacillus deserti]QDP39795.1 hypothetical protein FN924_06195 [Radiobacillus deserti]